MLVGGWEGGGGGGGALKCSTGPCMRSVQPTRHNYKTTQTPDPQAGSIKVSWGHQVDSYTKGEWTGAGQLARSCRHYH